MDDRLASVRRTAAWLDTASQGLWWNVWTMLVRQVRADPVLSAAFPPDPELSELFDPSQAPPDLEAWAVRAFLTLERYLDPAYATNRNRPGQLRAGRWGNEWETIHRAQTNDLYVRPVLAWLEVQSGALVEFHAGVARWVQRLRWFGARGDDEDFYQEELGRFLFDSGVAIEDIAREALSAGGRVDFLLRGRVMVPVELKLWRGARDNKRLVPDRAPAQATRYARDYRVPRSYLVVVTTGTDERLELPSVARTADGIELLLRVAEVRPPSPTQDRRALVARTLGDLGLLPE